MREWNLFASDIVSDRTSLVGDAKERYPGRPRITGISSHESQPLCDGWTYASVAPDSADHPQSVSLLTREWKHAIVPGTVASALQKEGQLNVDVPDDFDAVDWWYRCSFENASPVQDGAYVLCFEGLATLAEVWLNGVHVLSTDNMFIEHEVDVTAHLQLENELAIRFRSLAQALKTKRPRPKWRAMGIDHQQLRWHRTTLIGRMTGWSPPVVPVGPWRAVRLERRETCDVVSGDVYPVTLASGGTIDVELTLRMLGGQQIASAVLQVADSEVALSVTVAADRWTLHGSLAMPNAKHWWPHTHGLQPRYSARVVVQMSEGAVTIDFPPVAFRRVDVHRSDSGFAIAVNGVAIFCRGSCWTTANIASLTGSEEDYRRLLTLARDGGMNMLRIPGTSIYEANAFYDICDELGICIWQDFMFSRMDYPHHDATFRASVEHEVRCVLARLRRHPALTILCGNSEVEQQSAMLATKDKTGLNAMFYATFPTLCASSAPAVPYWPGSPSGGTLPFHVDSGVSHYFGVGAYLRPLEDARRSNVRFAAECLGFANVPDQFALDELLRDAEAPYIHPRWKARVPRDAGTGWDHDDSRDHYLREMFGLDPMRIRYSDMERYIALSRVVTGEVMGRTMSEWRSNSSRCRGALTWFFQDMWPGPGFGVVDSSGRPKPAYYFLRRAMQSVALSISNEGLNGLHLHMVNDGDEAFTGILSVSLLRGRSTVIASESKPVRIPARTNMREEVEAVIGRFHDASYAYRFGPAAHEVAVATLRTTEGRLASQAFEFPGQWPSHKFEEVWLDAVAWPIAERTMCIHLRSSRLATWIALECGDFIPDDNYFHMAPGTERIIHATSSHDASRFDGHAQPMNCMYGTRISLLSADPSTPSSDA